MRKKMMLIACTVFFISMFLGNAMGKSNDWMEDVIDFTPEQVAALSDVVVDHSNKLQDIINKAEEVVDQLAMEVVKDEGTDVSRKLRKDPKKIDKLIRDLASLTGDILKAKTEYLLKAKEVLTQEQKKTLLADLEYQVDYFNGESPFLFQLDDLAEILELNKDQIKSVITYRTDMVKKELDMKKDIAFLVLDIKDILASSDRKPGDIDDKVMKIADLGAKALKNKIDYILKSRNVLNPPQKQELHHLVLLTLHASSLIH